MWNSNKVYITCQILADQAAPREVPVGTARPYSVNLISVLVVLLKRFLFPRSFLPGRSLPSAVRGCSEPSAAAEAPLAATLTCGREQSRDPGQAGICGPRSACPGPLPSAAFGYKYTREGMLEWQQPKHGKYSRALVKIAPAVWKPFTCSAGWLPAV